MTKLYVVILLALIWVLIIVQKAGGEAEPVCFMNYSYNPVLSQKERVLRMIEIAGFDPAIADKVINCESGWNPEARGDSGKSWGIWQIHQPAHNLGSDSFDPYLSTVYAIELLKKDGWSPWTCARKLTQP